ncbi:uncharacterized protein LOC107826396 isoform X3 [Nicotiana tabacum]|uniref:Uncharacterized protein LOC107826396 isoform X3 n=2 Tax=Nicotiana tabacum TaxID=4097 RepID=A0AC58UDA6_TOBAC
MEVECTRIHQKIALSEKRIQNDIKALKKNLRSKIDTLLKLLDKPHEKTIEREPSVPISKDAVDDQCDDIDVHVEDHYESDYRDAHLEDETDIGIEIGKKSFDGVQVQDGMECQDDQDLENLLGTSISEIVCKCVEEIYDLSTPLSHKEKFGNQNDANQESFEAARKEDGVDYQDNEISKERSG